MDTTSDNRKGKALKVAGIVALAVVLALSGTFAWTSFSQQATNEFRSTANPGARLHDDFSWTDAKKNKDVYVENFTDPDNGGVNVYARVKLLEYLETGDDAGEYKPTPTDPHPTGANATDHSKWETHKFDTTTHETATNDFHKHFTWQYGGQTVYMPTFNKNKDSLEADVNGSYQDKDASGAQNPYCKYEEYAVGNMESGDAYYDADTNSDDEAKTTPGVAPGAGGIANTNYTSRPENHTAADTLSAEVISMADWEAAGGKNKQPGPYWVYDTDGWAYWAQPIEPGTATGLLLNNVELTSSFENSWYYAIDAVGEFVTAGEWLKDESNASDIKYYLGSTADPDKTMTKNAYDLLKAVAGDDAGLTNYAVTVTAPAATVTQGGTATFTAAITENGAPDTTGKTVTWSVAGATNTTDTKIDANTGVLTVAADERASNTLTVTATLSDDSSVKGTATITVAAPTLPTALQTLKSAPVANDDATNAVVRIGSTDYVKLAQDGNKVLVMTKDCAPKWGTSGYGRFDDSDNYWGTSEALNWCNTSYYNSLDDDIKKRLVDTEYKTKKEHNDNTTYSTTSKVFFLSEADVFGTENGSSAPADCYTFGNGPLVPSSLRPATMNGSKAWYWLRSPRGNGTYVAFVYSSGNSDYTYYDSTTGAARPAFWLNLAS